MWRDGAKIFAKTIQKQNGAVKHQPRWHATDRRCTCVVRWVVEQFRAASAVLFHFSFLTFLFVVRARNRHHLRIHVLVGNTTLRRRPRFVTRSAINADNKGTSLLVPFADDWTDLVLRAHGEASAHLRTSTCNMARGELESSS